MLVLLRGSVSTECHTEGGSKKREEVGNESPLASTQTAIDLQKAREACIHLKIRIVV
jgi:hypothetical protein